jgi:hypothetical protein
MRAQQSDDLSARPWEVLPEAAMVCLGSALTPRRSLLLHEVLEGEVQDLPPYSVP